MGWLRWMSAEMLTPREVGWDVHSHLLPGVDDGVDDVAAAERCVRAMAKLGYRGAVLTPHIYPEVYDNDERQLRLAFEDLAATLSSRVPGFELQLGAEYYFEDTLTDRLAQEPDALLRFGPGRRLLLMELPVMDWPTGLEVCITACEGQSIQPVIAHVERYGYGFDAEGRTRLRTWRQAGAMLQVNVGSFAGQYGSRVRRQAIRLWQEGLVDLLGSDVHGEDDFAAVQAGWRWLRNRGDEFDLSAHRAIGPIETEMHLKTSADG